MKITDYLSNTERKDFTRQSNWLAARMLTTNWLMVAGALRQKSVLMLPETARSSGAAGRDSLAEGGTLILCFWHRSV